MQIAPFFLPVAQHSLHAVGKELLPQYKQLYDYTKRWCGCVASCIVRTKSVCDSWIFGKYRLESLVDRGNDCMHST